MVRGMSVAIARRAVNLLRQADLLMLPINRPLSIPLQDLLETVAARLLFQMQSVRIPLISLSMEQSKRRPFGAVRQRPWNDMWNAMIVSISLIWKTHRC